MAGHSHWAGIKRQKEVADKKRGVVFSKLLAAITAAARTEPSPDFNPRLRTAVQKAKEAKIPIDNIERAIKRSSEAGFAAEELLFEAYGPGGTALLVEAIADSRNRAVAEIKKILGDNGGKWAEVGSVRWAFEQAPPGSDKRWLPRFPQAIDQKDEDALNLLVAALEENDAVQAVYHNAQ